MKKQCMQIVLINVDGEKEGEREEEREAETI
jgi:hypothetical protein